MIFLDLIYPPSCILCGKCCNNYLCKKCFIELDKMGEFKTDKYEDKFFEEHIYCFRYENIVRKLILDFKFNEKDYIYRLFIEFLKNNQKIYCKIKKYDIIVPVPISKKRLKTRGYNQSELIAREIANLFNLEYYKNVLLKKTNNLTQSTLTKDQRIFNVQGVYKINNKNSKMLYEKNVLILDDIYTTGSTVNECSKVLKLYGANKVGVFTIAKD